MILNPRATRSFVLIWIETLTEKSKYGLLDLRVHKQNDNLIKKIETQFCDTLEPLISNFKNLKPLKKT